MACIGKGDKEGTLAPSVSRGSCFYLPTWDCPGFTTRLDRWRCSRHAKNLPAPAPLCPTDSGRAGEKSFRPLLWNYSPPFSSGPPLPCHGSKSVRPQRFFQACMHCLSAPELLLFLVPPFALSVTARIGKLSLRCLQLWSAGCSYTPSVLLNLVDNCWLASRESFINSEEAAPPT